MKIETKFNIGDKVKYFKEGVGYLHGEIRSLQIYMNHNELIKTYIIELRDLRNIKTYEENIRLDK